MLLPPLPLDSCKRKAGDFSARKKLSVNGFAVLRNRARVATANLLSRQEVSLAFHTAPFDDI